MPLGVWLPSPGRCFEPDLFPGLASCHSACARGLSVGLPVDAGVAPLCPGLVRAQPPCLVCGRGPLPPGAPPLRPAHALRRSAHTDDATRAQHPLAASQGGPAQTPARAAQPAARCRPSCPRCRGGARPGCRPWPSGSSRRTWSAAHRALSAGCPTALQPPPATHTQYLPSNCCMSCQVRGLWSCALPCCCAARASSRCRQTASLLAPHSTTANVAPCCRRQGEPHAHVRRLPIDNQQQQQEMQSTRPHTHHTFCASCTARSKSSTRANGQSMATLRPSDSCVAA